MKYCVHILNLIVKEGLDTIQGRIENIHENVVYWTATPKIVEKIEDTARQLKISCSTIKFVFDCKTM